MSDASETDATEAADGSTEEDTSAGNTENTDDTQQNTGGNTEETPQEESEQEADCADDTADQTEILEQTEDAVEIVPEDETESGDKSGRHFYTGKLGQCRDRRLDRTDEIRFQWVWLYSTGISGCSGIFT